MRHAIHLLPLLLAACVTGPADRFREILPDDRLEIDEAAFDTLARSVGDDSAYYGLTRDLTREINGGVRDVLALVDEITAFQPSWTDGGTRALWGPWLDDGFHGQLWVLERADSSWEWAVEIRPEGSSEDAWAAVVAGEVDAGSTALHSTGRFLVDFTGIDAQGAGDGETGAMWADYELLADGAIATVAFGDFAEGDAVPADAGYRYEHTRGEGGLMDLAWETNVDDTAPETLELALVRSRWDAAGAGRADAYVTGGDLGALTFAETECWDAVHDVVYFSSNWSLEEVGDVEGCAFAEPSFAE